MLPTIASAKDIPRTCKTWHRSQQGKEENPVGETHTQTIRTVAAIATPEQQERDKTVLLLFTSLCTDQKRSRTEKDLEICFEKNDLFTQLTTPIPPPSLYQSKDSKGRVRDATLQTDDELAMKRFDESITFKDGRYYCSWPWKQDGGKFDCNFSLCMGRLKTSLKRLQKDPQLLRAY
uniref:Uncharacterized protein n=1 Tax=Parascaris univalens TaxID=6257 RepID=A0A915C837_PARUN